MVSKIDSEDRQVMRDNFFYPTGFEVEKYVIFVTSLIDSFDPKKLARINQHTPVSDHISLVHFEYYKEQGTAETNMRAALFIAFVETLLEVMSDVDYIDDPMGDNDMDRVPVDFSIPRAKFMAIGQAAGKEGLNYGRMFDNFIEYFNQLVPRKESAIRNYRHHSYDFAKAYFEKNGVETPNSTEFMFLKKVADIIRGQQSVAVDTIVNSVRDEMDEYLTSDEFLSTVPLAYQGGYMDKQIRAQILDPVTEKVRAALQNIDFY